MSVTEFQRACNINSDSYGRFMRRKGRYAGDSSRTYVAAFRFFEQRQKAGMKKPKKKKARIDKEEKIFNLAGVELDGEEDEAVPVYDTCDEIRRKVAAYLRERGVTQAAFLNELANIVPDPTVKFQSRQLKDFQAKDGPLAGNISRIYYAAYVFFEKRRIFQRKPKSRKREQNEQVWVSNGGIDRERRRKVWCSASSTPFIDRCGRIRVR